MVMWCTHIQVHSPISTTMMNKKKLELRFRLEGESGFLQLTGVEKENIIIKCSNFELQEWYFERGSIDKPLIPMRILKILL